VTIENKIYLIKEKGKFYFGEVLIAGKDK